MRCMSFRSGRSAVGLARRKAESVEHIGVDEKVIRGTSSTSVKAACGVEVVLADAGLADVDARFW